MSLLRSLRIPSLRAPAARLFSTTPIASTSSSPSSSSPAPSSEASSAPKAAPSRNPLSASAGLIPAAVSRERDDPDTWWRGSDLATHYGRPGNQYTGRSLPVRNFAASYKSLSAMIGRTGVKKEWRYIEYYEKPSAKRVRLNSERHRRRFQENIRKRVQLVEQLRSRQ